MQVVMLDFSPEHAISYNLLVDTVHRNLLTSDWYDKDHNESLVNPRNSKWAREMLVNVKQGCCVAGVCDLSTRPLEVKETLELLVDRLNLPPGMPPREQNIYPSCRSVAWKPSQEIACSIPFH